MCVPAKERIMAEVLSSSVYPVRSQQVSETVSTTVLQGSYSCSVEWSFGTQSKMGINSKHLLQYLPQRLGLSQPGFGKSFYVRMAS